MKFRYERIKPSAHIFVAAEVKTRGKQLRRVFFSGDLLCFHSVYVLVLI